MFQLNENVCSGSKCCISVQYSMTNDHDRTFPTETGEASVEYRVRVRYICIFFITMKSSFEGENLYYRLFLAAFLKYSSCIACQLFLINMGL